MMLRWLPRKEDWQKRIRQGKPMPPLHWLQRQGCTAGGRRYFLEQWELMMGQLKGQLERQAAAQKEKIREKEEEKGR